MAGLRKNKQQLRIIVIFALIVLAGGAFFYHHVESMDWVDSFYFSVITLTTVGYGDLSPQTDIGKIFTIFYVFVGVGIIATLARLLFEGAAYRYNHQQKRK